MARYGFKTNNADDRLAITNLMLQQGSIQHHQYQTLAQYQIKDVQLKPTNLGLGRPRRWTLAFNTNMVGMNMPTGEALWFAKEDRPVGDGYSTMDLNVDQFSQMLKGGLYVNPTKYLKNLKKKLNDKTFYRPTQANLMTIDVPGDALSISAGDFTGTVSQTHRYLVGSDLHAYDDVKPEEKTNLYTLVNEQVNEMAKTPITEVEQLRIPDNMALAQDQVSADLIPQGNAPEVNPVDDLKSQLRAQMNRQNLVARSVKNQGPKRREVPKVTNIPSLNSDSAMVHEQAPKATDQVVFDDMRDEVQHSNVMRQRRQNAEQSAVQNSQVEDQVSDLMDNQAGQAGAVDNKENNPQNFGQLMDMLEAQTQPADGVPRSVASRAYVDDFAQALQSSKVVNNQRKRQRVSENESQMDKSNSKDKDDDLTL